MTGNLKAEVVLPFGNGEYLFALKGTQVEELEYLRDKTGFGVIYQRVLLGGWSVGDLYEIIRLGLIGGGMPILEAKRIADTYCVAPYSGDDTSPESVARAIISAVMTGFEDLPTSGEQESPKP
ncbi:gene transfer agent family protein [Bartonella sp. LJL80]